MICSDSAFGLVALSCDCGVTYLLPFRLFLFSAQLAILRCTYPRVTAISRHTEGPSTGKSYRVPRFSPRRNTFAFPLGKCSPFFSSSEHFLISYSPQNLYGVSKGRGIPMVHWQPQFLFYYEYLYPSFPARLTFPPWILRQQIIPKHWRRSKQVYGIT